VVYLAKLNPAKKNEVGKVRPVVILTAQNILTPLPPVLFICPLSSQSLPEFAALHIKLEPRDQLKVISFALVEHCRCIASQRITQQRIAQLDHHEIKLITDRLKRLINA
jgi:mRNA interferase MazF